MLRKWKQLDGPLQGRRQGCFDVGESLEKYQAWPGVSPLLLWDP